jgi:hypothetical protein
MAVDKFGQIIAELPTAVKALFVFLGLAQFLALGFWIRMTVKEMSKSSSKRKAD